MAWYPVPSSIHGAGQFSSGDIIWKVSDEAGSISNPSWFYELKVVKIPGIAKPVLAKRDSRSSDGFSISSAEYWDNVVPDGQLQGSALFATIAEVGSAQLYQATTGLVDLWMNASGKVVATAPTGGGGTTGSVTIPIPMGGNVVITVQPQYGTVAVVSGAIQYTATAGYAGADAFTYEIRASSGELLGTDTCSFSTSSASATATPVPAKLVIPTTGDIRYNCQAGVSVTLYKNGDTNIVTTVSDAANVGYVLFSGVPRVQGDYFKAKAQKSGLTLSGFSVVCTTKRKPTAISGVTKTVAAGGSVSIAITELVSDSENAGLF